MIEDEEEINDTTNILLKTISIVVLLGMAIGFGIMPFFISSCRKTKFLGLANAFSGGLFLGIGLFHILPESSELLEELTEAPISYFCAFFSYALILFVEKVVFNSHALIHGAHEHEHEKEHQDTENADNSQEKLDKFYQSDNNNEDEQNIKQEETLEQEHKHEHEQNKSGSGITPYILLLALGFHGLFEGMALGIQSKIEGTLFLFLAIAAHKWAASLTLGIAFVKANVTKKRLIIMVSIFALIGPVGITFGLILSQTASDLVEGIFLAMSTGTFIYISCSEVIIDEFSNPNNKYLKFIMFMLGGIFTAGLALMEMIEHEGGEHEH